MFNFLRIIDKHKTKAGKFKILAKIHKEKIRNKTDHKLHWTSNRIPMQIRRFTLTAFGKIMQSNLKRFATVITRNKRSKVSK